MNEKHIPEILLEELAQLQEDIITRHERAGQVATGRTKASFSHKLTGFYTGVLEGAAYSGALERGRGPIKRLTPTDFLERLREWIVAKGLDYGGSPEGLERLAKFLRWWINKNGTWAFRSGQSNDIFTTPMSDFSARLTDRIGNLFISEVTEDLYNYKP